MTHFRSHGSSWRHSLTAYRITSWSGRALVAAAFIVHALTLADSSWTQSVIAGRSPGLATSFVLGLLEGLRYVCVTVEVSGATLLFVPGSTAVGAMMLSGVAFTTLFAQVFILGGGTLGPLLLFVAGAAIVSRRRRELIAIWRVHTRTHRPSLVHARPR